MADGGSFLSAGVGEPSRRAFLELDRKLGDIQAALATDITDHVADADPHPQYLTEARGDARYYTQSQVDSSLSGKSDTSHTHSYAAASHTHSYVPTSGGSVTGDFTVQGNLYVGKDGGADSNAYFYDDNTNTWRTLQWDDSVNDWRVEDNGGTMRTLYHSGNIPSYAASSHTHSYAATSHTHSYLPLSGGTLTGNLSLRSGNNVRDSIYRVGGIYFTWDSDSYGTNVEHSIRSTDGDSWSDAITINSYGNIRMNIDTNSNGTNTFTIGRQTTGTANTLLTLDESGNLTVTGVSRANEFHGDNGTSADPSFTFTSDTDLGLYRQGTNSLGFAPYGAYLNSAGFYLPDGDWFRTTGAVGWYNQTYGGGTYMTDSNYVRIYNDKGLRVDKNASSNYDTASVFIDSNPATLSFHPGGQAPQLRVGYNNNTIFCRNWADSGWCVVEADVIDRSSRKDKQDIADFRNSPSALSSDGDPTYERSGLDIAMALRPRHYRWEWNTHMRQLPTSERREKALQRLNRIRANKGLEPFESDELWHECGRDCDGTPDEPCWWVKDWQTGYFGFVAEEVGEVAPEATRFGEENDHTGVKTLAMTAIAIAAIQELTAKVEQLETQLQGE